MNCPNCVKPLLLAERQGVEVDYCPHCRGVWLDRGELDKIIERSSLMSSDVRDDRDRAPGANDPRISKDRKRRGSFLGELFDF
ncbi:MAG TPA: zf-TFIIB domain-containing protein [Fimbriimonadaceae bacterium]|nr:zf-TFIIB domain-containing protein [Fimbriimonadaceae bacterium]